MNNLVNEIYDAMADIVDYFIQSNKYKRELWNSYADLIFTLPY